MERKKNFKTFKKFSKIHRLICLRRSGGSFREAHCMGSLLRRGIFNGSNFIDTLKHSAKTLVKGKKIPEIARNIDLW